MFDQIDKSILAKKVRLPVFLLNNFFWNYEIAYFGR